MNKKYLLWIGDSTGYSCTGYDTLIEAINALKVTENWFITSGAIEYQVIEIK